MTRETPHPWDCLPTETPKAYAAFLAYVDLGARRSVREAARQHHSKTVAAGEISSVEDTTVGTWMEWSARHNWVSRGLARDEWIARTSDEQIIKNLAAAKLTLTKRARKFLKSEDGADFSAGGSSAGLALPSGSARGGCKLRSRI